MVWDEKYSTPAFRKEPLQLGLDSAVIRGHDVPARFRLPGNALGVVAEQVCGRRIVSRPHDLLLLRAAPTFSPPEASPGIDAERRIGGEPQAKLSEGRAGSILGGEPDNNLAYVNIVTSSPGFNPDNDSRMNKNLKLRSCEISQKNRRHISSRIRFRDLLFWISQNRTYGKVELIHPERGPGNSRFTFRIDRAHGGMPTGRSSSANRDRSAAGPRVPQP